MPITVYRLPLMQKTTWKADDFSYVIHLTGYVFAMFAGADTPFKKWEDVVDFAKKNPGKVTYATPGAGSSLHLGTAMVAEKAGIKLTHVPFKGAAEVHNAVASKQIMVAAINIGEALQYQKGGTPLRHLGQMSEKRSTLAPNIPTFKEQGFNVIMASLRGVAAPKGLPPAVREQLVIALQKTAADPEFQAKAAGYFAPLRYLAPAAYAQELKSDEADFRQLWQTAPWTDK